MSFLRVHSARLGSTWRTSQAVSAIEGQGFWFITLQNQLSQSGLGLPNSAPIIGRGRFLILSHHQVNFFLCFLLGFKATFTNDERYFQVRGAGNLFESRHIHKLLNFDRRQANVCSTPTNSTILNRGVRCTRRVAAIIGPNLIPPLFTCLRFEPNHSWYMLNPAVHRRDTTERHTPPPLTNETTTHTHIPQD